MIKEAIDKLTRRINLSEGEMSGAMAEIMEGSATPAQIASFLTALKMKGETVEEITAAALVMRKKAGRITAPEDVVDTCGTGGDLSNTFNISTTAAIVIAACGVPVAKHGNRSVSSRSGSADVLEALGVKIDLAPEMVEKCLHDTGFGFMFAPLFHPAMKHAAPVRREMGVRTIFNILGPLTNPAGARRQIMGVFAKELVKPLAHVLGNLGVVDAMVFHGEDGLDEITITGRTFISRFKNGQIENMELTPEDFGFKRAHIDAIKGGDSQENTAITMRVLDGTYQGAARDIVLMNAAAGLMVSNLGIDDIKEAVTVAKDAIDTGKALEKLDEIRSVTRRYEG
ncbi:anthranilate phosphoribosyltransferase [Candidatus Magnetominusculus dajiuhuensis]|uniref:anthranilate phosphoribosyltransferase n=1 Tax=Candidatus Magnetominusculus dajiuhuensis TaxID=3137712 RepID=UPI003B4367DC